MKYEYLRKGDTIETFYGRYVIEGFHGKYNSAQHLDTTFIPYIDDDNEDCTEGKPESRLMTNYELGDYAKEMDGRNHNYLFVNDTE